MILYQLKCPSDHRFEAWFRDSATYDAQAAAGLLTCPVCGDARIGKAPMAPRIAKSHRSKSETPPSVPERENPGAGVPAVAAPAPPSAPVDERMAAFQREVMRHLGEVRHAVEKSCDYVGDRFAEEARKIHYGETDARGIYGETTREEAEALQEEGVTFHRIPWLPRTNS
ncbi:hypothetical protein M2352_002759 [Azospirillum fermentarium]|uniref:DUF1178 family protein n=1 Tax=Azospirillum fermentarium TaxID=1233114 RepID=UPI002226739C|nr:DUF1178 family protein [Azospirillum fermentarium]MCW2247168.1 hypothetical protein [Azospirillum fermentarium]